MDYAEAGGHNRRRLPQITLTTVTILGNKHAWRLLAAFVVGQAVQLVLQAASSGRGEWYQTRFCMAAGFILAFVFFAGMLVDARTRAEVQTEKEVANEDKTD